MVAAMPSGHRLLPALLLLLLAGCATHAPRFPSNVAAGFVREPMRRLETRSLLLYYPSSHRAEAMRVAARLEGCVQALQAKAQGPREKLRVFLTRSDFNNAYVSPLAPAQPQQMVLPDRVTLELFDWFGLGSPDTGDIACHEAVHYVQLQQVEGLFGLLNTLSGGVLQPNIFTETWFLEGLATWYEGHLGRRVGRPHSPIFRGWWESGAAQEVEALHPGYLNPGHRDVLPFGGNYQTGFFFVEWLARTHGEERLWALVENVGQGVTLNLGITLRFRAIYGKDIGSLFEDFRAHLQKSLPRRVRPEGQQVLQADLGYVARLATAPDGTLAVLYEGRDTVPTLRVLEADGRVRFSHWLTPLLPPRPHIVASPIVVSGLRFSASGRHLFAVLGDVDMDGNTVSRLLQLDARTGQLVRQWAGLEGKGGDVTPDGRAYVYVEVEGTTHHLVRLELADGARTRLTTLPHGQAAAMPAVSPSGQRVAFLLWQGEGYDVAVLEPEGRVRPLTRDVTFDFAPRWVDERRLLFLREVDGRAQVHLVDVDTPHPVQVSDVPYLAFDPAPLGEGRMAFLNREGWHWTLDTLPLPAAEQPAVQAAPAPAQAALSAPQQPPPSAPTVLADTPYSPLEDLFLPQLRAPYGSLTTREGQLGYQVGLALSGADRLSFHSWGLDVYYDSFEQDVGVSAGYGNHQLAPWFLSLSGSRFPRFEDTDWTVRMAAQRTFWTTPLGFSVLGFQRDTVGRLLSGGQVVGLEPVRVRLAGASAATSYFAGDSTADGGLQRALGVSVNAALYGARQDSAFPAFNTRQALGDVRLELFAALPLPGLSTDSFTLTALGRMLPNAPAGLLRVGGIGPGLSSLGFDPEQPEVEEPNPPPLGNLLFSEYLRGYEDRQLAATQLGVLSARYRVSALLDRGWASFLYLFPSFFVRQLDVDGFATWALTDGPSRDHRVAGSSVALRTELGMALPLTLRYQFAWRFDDGLGPLHLVSLEFL